MYIKWYRADSNYCDWDGHCWADDGCKYQKPDKDEDEEVKTVYKMIIKEIDYEN